VQPNRYRAFTIILVLILAGSVSSLIWSQTFYAPAERTRPLRAALIDELAITNPDPYLVSNITSTLTKAGYTVDYHGPKDITVEFFNSLPLQDYGIVILRDHSTSLTGDVIALVTSEPFDPGKYVNEQQAGMLIRVSLDNSDYFGVTPTFVRESMHGIFPNTILVVMGCAGLANSEMAQAFVARGAEVYVSWNDVVLANRSDGGTILLVQSLTAGHRLDDALAWATENAPATPPLSSQLEYFPIGQGGLVLNPGI
jgi:hypothetical protein